MYNAFQNYSQNFLKALMWLHDFYWMVALKPDGSAPLTKSSMSKIRDMLGAYKDARKKQLKGKGRDIVL
jgi:hypothetical protein